MHNFKVGDRVQIIGEESHKQPWNKSPEVGSICIVDEVSSEDDWIGLEEDRHIFYTPKNLRHYSEFIERIEKALDGTRLPTQPLRGDESTST